MADMLKDLKAQGVAILIMVSIAIMSVLGMIILAETQDATAATANIAPYVAGTNTSVLGQTVNTTVTAFVAGFALVGTFATVTMLIIVVKGIIGVVRNLS